MSKNELCEGNPGEPVCLDYAEDTNTLTLTDQYGNPKTPINLGSAKVTTELVQLGDACELRVYVNKVLCDSTDLVPLLSKIVDEDPPVVATSFAIVDGACILSTFVDGNKTDETDVSDIISKVVFPEVEDPAVTTSFSTNAAGECILTTFVNGNETDTTDISSVLDKLETPDDPVVTTAFEVTDGACILKTFVNDVETGTSDLSSLLGKVVFPEVEDPDISTALVYDEDAGTCNLELSLNGDVVDTTDLIPLLSKVVVCLELGGDPDTCQLILTHGEQTCTVALPNFVTGVTIDAESCTITTSFWKGDPLVTPYLESISLDKQDDGSGVLTVKGTTCQIFPPTPPDGYSQLGLVQADGTDGNGNMVLDFAGDVIDPGTEVINYFDKDGNYVNSKDCTKATVFSDDPTVTVTPDGNGGFGVSVSHPDVPDVPNLRDCSGAELGDGQIRILTLGQGHAPSIASEADLRRCVDISKGPALPECRINGMRTFTDQPDFGTVEWEMRGNVWVPVNFSPFKQRFRGSVNSPDITDDMLAGLIVVPTEVDTNGTTVAGVDVTLNSTGWSTVGTSCVTVENTDCVDWVMTGDWRWNFSAAAYTGNFWTARVVGSGDLSAGNFNGTAVNRIDSRCNKDDCTELTNQLLTSELHFDRVVNAGETATFCAELQVRINTHVPDTENGLAEQTFALNMIAERSCT